MLRGSVIRDIHFVFFFLFKVAQLGAKICSAEIDKLGALSFSAEAAPRRRYLMRHILAAEVVHLGARLGYASEGSGARPTPRR